MVLEVRVSALPPGYEPRPQYQVMLAAGLLGAMLSCGALFVACGVHTDPAPLPSGPAASPTAGAR